MDFSDALYHCKDGFKIARDGWEASTYVVLQKGYPEGIPINKNTAEATGLPEGTKAIFTPYLMGHNQGVFMPWQPCQGDVLAEDWGLVLNL